MGDLTLFAKNLVELDLKINHYRHEITQLRIQDVANNVLDKLDQINFAESESSAAFKDKADSILHKIADFKQQVDSQTVSSLKLEFVDVQRQIIQLTNLIVDPQTLKNINFEDPVSTSTTTNLDTRQQPLKNTTNNTSSTPGPKFCAECGKPRTPGSKFCSECGYKF